MDITSLAEVEGLLRQSKVTITPVNTAGTEELSLPGDAGAGDEKFLVTMQDQRAVQGTILLYQTRTGEAVRRDINAVKQELAKTHRDPQFPEWVGKPMFTLDGAKVPKVEVGTYLCPLNPKHDDWHLYQAVGARPCRKATLPHELAVQSHLRVKHRQTWANAEARRRNEIDEEERAYRRWQMAQSPMPPVRTAGQVAEREGLLRQAKDGADEPQPTGARQGTKTCEVCGEAVTGTTGFGLAAALKAHHRAAHPVAE